MKAIKTKQAIFVAFAILCAVSCITVRVPVLAQNADSTKTQLTSLREKRRDTLKSRVELVERLVEDSRRAPEALLDARDDLLDAEYELAMNSDKRIEVLQQKLENAKQMEALMTARKHQANGTEVEVLAAKARRLAIEIELVKEQETR